MCRTYKKNERIAVIWIPSKTSEVKGRFIWCESHVLSERCTMLRIVESSAPDPNPQIFFGTMFYKSSTDILHLYATSNSGIKKTCLCKQLQWLLQRSSSQISNYARDCFHIFAHTCFSTASSVILSPWGSILTWLFLTMLNSPKRCLLESLLWFCFSSLQKNSQSGVMIMIFIDNYRSSPMTLAKC